MLELSGIPKDQHTSEVQLFDQYGSCRPAHWLKAYKKVPHNADSKVFSCVALNYALSYSPVRVNRFFHNDNWNWELTPPA